MTSTAWGGGLSRWSGEYNPKAKFILNRHGPATQQCIVDGILYDPLTLASMRAATAELYQ